MISSKRLAQTQNHKCKNTFFSLSLSSILLLLFRCLKHLNARIIYTTTYTVHSVLVSILFFRLKKKNQRYKLCFDLIMWFSHVSYPVIPADVRYVRKEKIVIQVNWLMTITPLHIWYDVCVCVCTRLNNQKIYDNSVSEWAGCMFWYLI